MNLNKTEKLMSDKMKNKAFDSYAILVYSGGEERLIHSPNTNEDTYFDIASMGKVLVTSTLILKAADEKRISLDDTLTKFFENVPEEKKCITVKQLLTHTSGIVRFPINESCAAENNTAKKRRVATARFILNTPLAYEPGKSEIYSCNGMILLGYILEIIYNKSLEEIFTEKIKRPLGYTRSKFNIENNEPNAAVCYRSETTDGYPHPWDDENIRALGTSAGSGGQFFTLNDINKFAKAVMSKSAALYSENIFDLAERNYTKNTAEGRGLGWLIVTDSYSQTGKLFPAGSFGHCGHTGTSMFFSRKNDMYVLILTNATRFLNMKNNFNGYDYGDIMKMREEIHNAIYEDLNSTRM